MLPDLSTVMRRASDRFSDYRVTRTVPVAIPVIDLTVSTSYWEKTDLSIFEQFFLRAIDLVQNSLNAISQTFGLDEDESSEKLAIMLQHGLLDEDYELDGTHKLYLTEKGKSSKRDNNKRIIRHKQFGCGYHSFSKSLIDQSLVKDAIDADDIAKRGIYIPPLSDDEPSIAEIDIEDLKALWSEDIRNRNLELIQPMNVVRARRKFLDGYIMVEMRDIKSADQKILLYKNAYFDEQASLSLQNLVDSEQSIPVFPDEDDYFEEEPVYRVYPEPFQQVIKEKTVILHRLLDRNEELEVGLTTTDESLAEDPSILLAEKVKNDTQIEEVTSFSGNVTQEYDKRLLRTDMHRSILIKALSEAAEEVYIASAGISQDAIDEEFVELFGNAIERGVSVHIDWGMFGQGNSEKAQRQRAGGAECKRILEHAAGNKVDQFKMHFKNTHDKILICDHKFVVIGSFNWLGWDGKQSKKARWETSLYDEDPSTVELFFENYGRGCS